MRYLFMNTIQTQVMSPAKSANNAADAPVKKADQLASSQAISGNTADYYSASAANDSVVAKVLTQSLTRSIDGFAASRMPTNTSEIANRSPLKEKFNIEQMTARPTFDVQQVSNNVIGFVQGALSNLANSGRDAQELAFYRDEAVKGVSVGIDQAKLELVGLASDDVFKTIDATKGAIIGGINNLPTTPDVYIKPIDTESEKNVGTEPSFNTVELLTNDSITTKVDFENRAFDARASVSEVFTSSSSNISFSITGDLNNQNVSDIADLVNKTDGLLNGFYRSGVESAYEKSLSLGYSNTELVNLANQIKQGENLDKMQTYDTIQQLSFAENIDATAPKAVADYINKYLDVIDSSKKTLESDEDFNQIINGIVNQMKDVQVPDLLKAINRFHAFNKNFS